MAMLGIQILAFMITDAAKKLAHPTTEMKRNAPLSASWKICKSGIPFVNQGVQMQIERTPAESRDGDVSALQKVKNQKPLNRHSYTWFTALPFFRLCFRGKFEHLVGPSSYFTGFNFGANNFLPSPNAIRSDYLQYLQRWHVSLKYAPRSPRRCAPTYLVMYMCLSPITRFVTKGAPYSKVLERSDFVRPEPELLRQTRRQTQNLF
ncbi:hypothetical protein BJV77DRAFT_1150547 [Russula vinacea]|nr:hypothetical protein BJV77DRAFT_1150547 [Russula vinacea]